VVLSANPAKLATAVLFDFGGTLDADGLRWSVRFYAAYRAAGGRLELHEFDKTYRESDRVLERLPGIRGLGFRAMIDAQARLLESMLPDSAGLDFHAIADRFHRDAVRMIERNARVLSRLAAHYRLGIISNFTGNLSCCLAELGLTNYFHTVTDSAVFGASKPAPEIFHATLAALDVEPQAAWFVGDNLDADIRPARTLGLSTCWLTEPERVTPDDCAPTARIATLTELPEVVCTA
jgi:HAD superfamily hydrolase (TIGR01509 family)